MEMVADDTKKDDKLLKEVLKLILRWAVITERQYELDDKRFQVKMKVGQLETERRKTLQEIILLLNDSGIKLRNKKKDKNEVMYR